MPELQPGLDPMTGLSDLAVESTGSQLYGDRTEELSAGDHPTYSRRPPTPAWASMLETHTSIAQPSLLPIQTELSHPKASGSEPLPPLPSPVPPSRAGSVLASFNGGPPGAPGLPKQVLGAPFGHHPFGTDAPAVRFGVARVSAPSPTGPSVTEIAPASGAPAQGAPAQGAPAQGAPAQSALLQAALLQAARPQASALQAAAEEAADDTPSSSMVTVGPAPRPAGAQLIGAEPAAGPGPIGRAPAAGAHFFAANSAALFMSASPLVAQREPAPAAPPAPPRAPSAAATALLNGATSAHPAVTATIAAPSPETAATPGPGLAGSAAARALSSLAGSVRAPRPDVETVHVVKAPIPPPVAQTDNTRSPDAAAPPAPPVAAANHRGSDILPAKKKGLFRRR